MTLSGRSPLWQLAVMTCGSIICCSLFTCWLQREKTTTAASPSMTNNPPTLFAHERSHKFSKLIFRKKMGFISMFHSNADFHVSLIHFRCYCFRHFSPVIVIPPGRENDINLTNAVFFSVNQPGEIMESNVQLRW